MKKMICINTFDKHNGKIWTLYVSDNYAGEQKIMTGANDSTLYIWEDATVEEEIKIKDEANKKILDQQQLNNLMRQKRYLEAAKLAFDLNLKKGFINILETLVNLYNNTTTFIFSDDIDEMEDREQEQEKGIEYESLKDIVIYCLNKDVRNFILIVRDLNTTAKYAKIAQEMLNIVVNNIDPDKLCELGKKYKKEGENDKSFAENIEILLAFSERNFDRMRKYVKKSYFLDFVLKDYDFNEDLLQDV